MPQDIEFHLPFPTRGDPARGDVRERSLTWARQQGLVVTPVDEQRFRDADIAKLMAHWVPDAEGPDLDLAVNAVVVATLIDDQFDGPLGTDPDAVAVVCADFKALIAPESTAVPRTPLGRALAEVWRDIGDQASSEWLARTRRHWHWYLDAHVNESANRTRRAALTVEEHFVLRRRSGMVPAMMDLSEKAYHFESTPLDRRLPQIQRMVEIAADVVDTVNDVHSLEKEESRGDVHNLVLVLERERRCTRSESLDAIRRVVESWGREFEDLARQLAGERNTVQLLIDRMRDAMGGYVEWSRRTRRYSQLIPPHEPASATPLV